MADHTLSQVEDRIVAVLAAASSLSGMTVAISQGDEIAFDGDGLLVSTASYAPDVFDEGNYCLIHRATIDIEAIRRFHTSEVMSRVNRNTLAAAHNALMTDRTLGIGLQDIEIDDMAPTESRGKDVDSASLRLIVTWFTPLNDMTVISHS